MSRTYSVVAGVTSNAGTGLPLLCTWQTAATVRPKWFDILVGASGVPADYYVTCSVNRMTAAPTGHSVLTPSPIDPADGAAVATAGKLATGAGTIGVALMNWAQNQRATFRWVAAPGKELVSLITTVCGIGIYTLAHTAAMILEMTVFFEE